ncbi:SidA/IucD/PvdA family monooxygenase, partial [Streptomyces sp. SID7803]|nr:SidA/IucD/PvdA family monooxygenase [Streptomyces sp. SID7803]
HRHRHRPPRHPLRRLPPPPRTPPDRPPHHRHRIRQSGAEIFLDLLRARPPATKDSTGSPAPPPSPPWSTPNSASNTSPPDYTRYFHALPEPVRDTLVPQQWQLHKGIDHDTITAIHDELYRRTLHGGWPDATLTPGVAYAPPDASPTPASNSTSNTPSKEPAPASPPTPS